MTLFRSARSSGSPRRKLPLRDRRLDEQRGVGVALAVVLRVQRAEADRDVALEHRLVLDAPGCRGHSASNCFASIAAWIFSKSKTLVTGCSLPPADDPAARRVGVDAVRRLRNRQEVQDAGHLRRIDHRHAVHHRRLAVLDRLLGRAPVDDGRVVAIALGRVGLQRRRCHLASCRRSRTPSPSSGPCRSTRGPS